MLSKTSSTRPSQLLLLAASLLSTTFPSSHAAPTTKFTITSQSSTQIILSAPLHEDTFDITRHLGTKGAYPIRSAEVDEAFELPGCELVHVQMVTRHGTRAPTEEDIAMFDELEAFTSKAGSCLFPEYDWMRSWENPFEMQNEGLLAEHGKLEAFLFGKRTMSRYGTLFADVPYNPNVYLFSSSGRSRSGQTGNSFGAGLFSAKDDHTCENTPIYMTTSPQEQDHIMNPQKSCPAWRKDVINGPTHEAEMEAWRTLRLPPIANRLSETTCLDFAPDHALAAFKACAFEWSVFGKKDGWCTMFTRDEVAWLEYGEDLDDWLENGYGHDLNGKIACRLVTDIVEGLKGAADGSSRIIGDFKFGHSETLLALVTSLGMFKDSHRLTGAAPTPELNRSFRTSHIAPFLANMAFELYRCTTTNTYKIRALLNEQPIVLPGCDEQACDLEMWEDALGDLVGCNIDGICGKDKGEGKRRKHKHKNH